MSFAPSLEFKKNARKLPFRQDEGQRGREGGRERGDTVCMEEKERTRARRKENFSINSLFNVSAPVPLWERGRGHTLSIIQPHGDSRPQDPELVVRKTPRWINSAEAKGNAEPLTF